MFLVIVCAEGDRGCATGVVIGSCNGLGVSGDASMTLFPLYLDDERVLI
jgi:hypothetical protein